jgi:hypothetical protein
VDFGLTVLRSSQRWEFRGGTHDERTSMTQSPSPDVSGTPGNTRAGCAIPAAGRMHNQGFYAVGGDEWAAIATSSAEELIGEAKADTGAAELSPTGLLSASAEVAHTGQAALDGVLSLSANSVVAGAGFRQAPGNYGLEVLPPRRADGERLELPEDVACTRHDHDRDRSRRLGIARYMYQLDELNMYPVHIDSRGAQRTDSRLEGSSGS